MTISNIAVSELAKKNENGNTIDLIDVRTPVEFRELHAQPAQNIPLDRLDPQKVLSSRMGASNEPLYVICRSGSRAAQACEKFLATGFTDVVNVEGGTEAWNEAGLPVVRGKKAISLERQVRIAAGLLVVLGVALGWLVHSAFLGLSAFVGVGLTFAGLTDWCGMGMLLARMPWNQVSSNSDATQCST